MNRIRNQNSHDHSVSEEDYQRALHDWLIGENADAIRLFAMDAIPDAT